MKNVKLIIKTFFLILILVLANDIYSSDDVDCSTSRNNDSSVCNAVAALTDSAGTFAKAEKGFWSSLKGIGDIFSKGKVNFDVTFDDHILKCIKVKAVKNNTNTYFNPKIQVCDYNGEGCKIIDIQYNCHHIYGDLSLGGIAAGAFIDWEGSETKPGEKIANGLEWTWAENVTEDEKKKFANSPKICACSKKGACFTGVSEWTAQVSKGENIFSPGYAKNTCDDCYQKKVKCAPIPLEPGPPPFCDQLPSSLPEIKVVPVQNNDYFEPQLRVIGGNLKEAKHLGFSNHSQEQIITQDNHTYYFKTERKDNQLCAEYYGTKEIKEENLEFTRCFLSPDAPQPKKITLSGDGLTFTIKMIKEMCKQHGLYDGEYNGICTINLSKEIDKKIGPLSFKIVTPKMRNTKNDTDKVDPNEKDYNQVFKETLRTSKIFNTLKQYDCAPKVIQKEKSEVPLDKNGNIPLLDKNGDPNVRFIYETENKQGKMLCVSGWKPKPDEYIYIKEQKPLRLISLGSTYAQYRAVYSEESNRIYYVTDDNKTTNLSDKTQKELDAIVFDNEGYMSIPEKSTCVVNKDEEVEEKAKSGDCSVAYKLIDKEHKENCHKEQSTCKEEDGYSCNGNECIRSTKYMKKEKDKLPDPFFYPPFEKQKNNYVKKQPIKVDATEVFYADDLCTFDLEGLKENINSIMKRYLKSKKSELESESNKTFEFGNDSNYTGNLSKYKYVEIEAWGGGEAGHIEDKAKSDETRIGKPGDYIKAKLKIDKGYPFFRIKVTEGGGRIKDHLSNKDGGPTIIEICPSSDHSNCKELVTIRGGGKYHKYGLPEVLYDETKIHRELQEGEDLHITKGDDLNHNNKNKEIAYIENNKINFDTVNTCKMDYMSNRYGAGGCIDTETGTYGRGKAGGAIIKPIMEEIPMVEIEKTIDNLLEDKNSNNTSIKNNEIIKTLDDNIHEKIKEKIQEQLSCKD
ncbi:MAG: hypothetical protein KTV77_04590 [Wolbachia endosymbiont of Fragariocoptes setiger]|nr:hypothetical protein [Wolbachia endosymbiont of Fragariocoptes setiger]